MAVAVQSETAVNRPLALRMRGDLEIRPQRFGHARYWAVKDPIALKYFHLRDEEHAVLTMLDGQTSLEQIRARCEQAFAPQAFSHLQLQGFLGTLHRHGLLLADSSGQAEQLLARRGDERRRRAYEALLSVLAIRFRGIDPQRLLDWLYPKFQWLLSPLAVGASLSMAAAAALLLAVEFDTFHARLPDFRAILAASNLPWLAVALATAKIMHEVGHALACRRFGGRCHEIGLMLLVFTPCLYCNVSDSWMLPGKWQRVAIAAAGMYVELILASICTFLWWWSAPGLFNSLCLDLMLVCSLSTVAVNGNPLLRYDGYFILSDLAEVPNLRAQSTAAVRRLFTRYVMGVDVSDDRQFSTRRRGLLVLYAVASTVYRWFVVGAILWTLNEAVRPYHLEVLVVVLAGVTLVGMVWPAAAQSVRWVRRPAVGRRIAPTRAALAVALLVAAGLLTTWLPLPMRVAAPVVVEYRDAQRVYVTVPGALVSSLRYGQSVRKGETIAQLNDAGVELEVARLTSQRDGQRLYLADLEARRLQGSIDGSQIPAAQAALADAEQQLEQYQHDADQLKLVAPVDGTLLPPPNVPRKPRAADKLDRWSGAPLDPQNRGSYLERGTLVCLVGDPTGFEADLHVEQTDVDLVQVGQRVRLVLDHLPGDVFWGRVVEVAKLDLAVMPRELAAAGDLPARTDRRGVSRPLDTWYQARVLFDEAPPYRLARVHGRAKIVVAGRSLASQLTRYLKQTFSR